MEVQEEIRTKKARVSLLQEKLIKILIDEEAEIGKDDIVEINEAKKKLAGAEKYCVLFITPHFGSISSEARAYSASLEVYENAIAKAIIVPNLGQRLVGSFFIKFNRPPAPTRLFSTADEAVTWLNQKLKN